MECHGWHKIGVTKNPDNRLSSIQSSNPFSVQLIHTIPVRDHPYVFEKHLHDMFKDRDRSGEWFRLSCDDALYVRSIRGVITTDMSDVPEYGGVVIAVTDMNDDWEWCDCDCVPQCYICQDVAKDKRDAIGHLNGYHFHVSCAMHLEKMRGVFNRARNRGGARLTWGKGYPEPYQLYMIA